MASHAAVNDEVEDKVRSPSFFRALIRRIAGVNVQVRSNKNQRDRKEHLSIEIDNNNNFRQRYG
jgi:hypothetical protein